MNDQISANASLERKATLFLTSSLAVLGYLITNKPAQLTEYPYGGILLFLAVSAIFGVIATFSFKLGAPGCDPKQSWDNFPNAVELMRDYIVLCQEKIDISAKSLKWKEATVGFSMLSFYAGILLLFQQFFTTLFA